MCVDAQGDGRIAVSELSAGVRDRFAGPQEQQRERVPQLMRPPVGELFLGHSEQFSHFLTREGVDVRLGFVGSALGVRPAPCAR
jgi:hypothetical protein